MIEELERILCSHPGLSSKEKQEIFDKVKAQQKKIDKLEHNISVRDQVELWPTWKIKAIDSFTIMKGGIFDRLFKAEDKLTAANTLIDQVKELIKEGGCGCCEIFETGEIEKCVSCEAIAAIEAFEGGRG